MWRRIHSWLGLALAVLVLVLAVSGALLATKPLYDAYRLPAGAKEMSVAAVIEQIAKAQPRITPQRLSVSVSGEAKLSYSKNNRLQEQGLSLQTGALLREQKEPEGYVWLRKLHRSLLLGENGRIFPALGALVMLVLAVSGVALLLRRLGGVRQLFAPMSWQGAGQSHSALGRLALLPLLITTITALWLSAVTFDWVSAGADKPPAYPESLQELEAVEPWTLHGLQEIQMASVREVIYPIAEDWFDVWTVQTDREYVFIDQFTGDVLSREALPFLARVMDWVLLLHTGEGSPWWAVVLLLVALSVPYFVVTGVMVWWRGRQLGGGRLPHQASTAEATVLLLVGSEGGSTWGFAKALHEALHASGEQVRTIEMNALGVRYPKLEMLLLLTSTYGDGDAPQSATRFLTRLAAFEPAEGLRHATLAFGDRAFVKFCAFGEQVALAVAERCGEAMLPLGYVDQQSSQAFTSWCAEVGRCLGYSLVVDYVPKRPKTQTFYLKEKTLYGEALNVPLAVLRLGAGRMPKHESGDWLAVYAPNCAVPRLYSLGSHSKYDDAVEICVRYQQGGVCSPWLCHLSLGEAVEGVVVRNPRFHLPKKGAVVMIGAGTGIAPFVGMIRHNHSGRALDLFWGGRQPEVDGLYGDEIVSWLADGRLAGFYPAWSRVQAKEYVQAVVARERSHLIERLHAGAVVMICGGREMAAAVCVELAVCAQAVGLTLDELRQQNRLLEDIY